MRVQLCLSLGELRQSFVAVNLQHFFFSFLYGKFFFFVAVRAMPRGAAALAARFVIPYFFWLACFVIYMISCGSAHFFNFAKRFFSFHFSLTRVISVPQVLLSNFMSSLRIAIYHASLSPLGDIQTPGSSSFL